MKFVKTAALAFTLMFLSSATASAQAPAASTINYPFGNTQALAVAFIIMGAAMGIGGLTKSAVESMARQPETAANIQTAMIISAALIEGVTFFALIIVGFILRG